MPTGTPSRFNRREVPTRIFIPPDVFSITQTITITHSDNSTTDVTSRRIGMTINGKNIINGIARAIVTLDNSDGFFHNPQKTDFIFIGGETLTIDVDYGGGTTRIFKGKCNAPKVEFDGNSRLILTAYTLPEIAGRKIKINIDGNAKDAVKSMVDTFLSSVLTYNNFNTNLGSDTKTIKVSYNDYILEIFSDIFRRVGWDGSIDFDPSDTGKHDLLGHVKGSIDSSDVNIAIQQNLANLANYGIDSDEEFNDITINGKNIGGAPILYTSLDSSHQSKFWRKDLEVNDNAIINFDEASERGTVEISKNVQDSRSGIINSIGNPNIVAGNTITCSAQNELLDGKVIVTNYTHIIDDKWTMTVDIEKRQRRTDSLFRERIKVDNQLATFDNPNNMLFSLNMDFDETTDDGNLIASKNNITVAASKIQISTGTSSTVISITRTLPQNVTQWDMILKNSEQFEVSLIEASNTAGATYILATSNQQSTVFNFDGSDKRLKIRITLKADGGQNQFPSLDGITIRAK